MSSVFSVLFLCPLPLVTLRVFMLFPEILLSALGRARGTQENWGRGRAGTLTYNQCWTQHCLLAKLQLHMFYSANNAGDGKREVSTVHGRYFFQPVGHKRVIASSGGRGGKTGLLTDGSTSWSHWEQAHKRRNLSYSMSGGRFHKENHKALSIWVPHRWG